MSLRHYKEGADRQSQPLPPTLDECIDADNPARAIDAYVEMLDLEKMGFEYAGGELTRGQPAYHPEDLLKLYIWGYINRTNSSHRLELEARRDLEVIWLLKGLRPSYRTICFFRVHNKEVIKHVGADFISVCQDLELLGGETAGIDGAFFEGDASKGSIKTKTSLERRATQLAHKIDNYLAEMDAEDQDEIYLQTIRKDLRCCQDKLKVLEKSGETQYSSTDHDARLLKKPTGKGPTAGYNVQIAVDSKCKIIVAHDVVNDGNDSQQLAPMAKKAKEAMGSEHLTVLADGAYYNQMGIKECIEANITPYVPVPKKNRPADESTRFERDDFQYNPECNAYTCPAGALLKPSGTLEKKGKKMNKYSSKAKNCAACSLCNQCLPQKTPYRQIYRWEYEEIADQHKDRMKKKGAEQMKKRAALAEHPFGTLKLWLGWTHFLLRGFEKVRAELELLVLSYNFRLPRTGAKSPT